MKFPLQSHVICDPEKPDTHPMMTGMFDAIIIDYIEEKGIYIVEDRDSDLYELKESEIELAEPSLDYPHPSQFDSVHQAADYIFSQNEPMEVLAEIVEDNIKKDELGFASELITCVKNNRK